MAALDLGTLRPVGEELWAVETPLRFLGLQVGRRMAVVRLASGQLLVHSPARLTDELRDGLDALGRVGYVVPASALHGHVFMEDYRAAYPDALLFATPGLQRRRRDLHFDGELGDSPASYWEGELEQTLFRFNRGQFGTEVVLCHRRSHSLLTGDFLWNVTPAMPVLPRLWAGWSTGAHPTPMFRLAIRDRQAARAGIERVLGWDFERILPGHGEILESGGRQAVRQAYAGLLDG